MHKYAHKKFCLFFLKNFMKNKKLFACFTKKTSQNFIYLQKFEGKNAFSVYKSHLNVYTLISSAVCLQFPRLYVLPEETESVILLF